MARPESISEQPAGYLEQAVGHQPHRGQPAHLLVVQAKDGELLKRAVGLLLTVIEQELIRQDSKDRPKTETYRGLETVHVGNDLHLARAGSACGRR